MALKMPILNRVCLALIITVSLAFGYWTVNWTFKQHRLSRQENELMAKKLKDLKSPLQKCISTAKPIDVLNIKIAKLSEINRYVR